MTQDKRLFALKIFVQLYRTPRIAESVAQMRLYKDLPGLEVCNRRVLTPERDANLLHEHPDLIYAVLMPWVIGETWQEIIVGKTPITPDMCRTYAHSLAHTLATMEQHHIAHCDLSGPNVIVLPKEHRIALIDVEDLYGPSLIRPEQPLLPSPGYRHRNSPDDMWFAQADRFAGAILLAETLGWCDPRIRMLACGEQYFDASATVDNSRRADFMQDVLRIHWGPEIADTFGMAWNSDKVENCPSLTTWEQLISATNIPKLHPTKVSAAPVLAHQPVTIPVLVKAEPKPELHVKLLPNRRRLPRWATNGPILIAFVLLLLLIIIVISQ